MKAILLLPAAYLAAGFVIPGQDSIESLIGFSFDTHHAISESLFNEHEEEPAPSASYTEELANNLEIVSELALYPPQTPHPSYPEGFVKQTGDNDFDLDSNTDDLRTRGHCHHGNRNKTTYQLLTSGKKTSLFGKLISEFDDIVNLLNSTDKSHTVLVPRDKVLKRAMHHHVPKEYVKKFIEYHILAEPKTARDIYHSRTIRTVLEQDELGDHDQRISTQFGITGLTINYISHIVMANLCAKNGYIHVLDHFLLPPFQSSETLSFVPSIFSALDFGLLKTGLYEKLNDTSTHTGGTFFAPTNLAFRKLGPRLNAFLFSQCGEKYLKALLKYHTVFDHTLYSDAYHKPGKDGKDSKSIHVKLPTLLEDHCLSVDIAGHDRFAAMKINGFITVASTDVVARDGVIHVLNDVLIPPKHPHRDRYPYMPRNRNGDDSAVASVEDLIERLKPYITDE